MLRIGQGFDLHALVKGRKLILGGVIIPHDYGLQGHSDADVLIHAIIDSLIGALALGDIGKFFPDTDNLYKDADSRELLRQVITKINNEHSYTVVNIDSTIIIEKPRLRDYIDKMRENIASDLNIYISQVNVKAKTSEGVGIVGRKEAVVAEASVLLSAR